MNDSGSEIIRNVKATNETVNVLLDLRYAKKMRAMVAKTMKRINKDFEKEILLSEGMYLVVAEIVKSFGESPFNMKRKKEALALLGKIETLLRTTIENHRIELPAVKTISAW